MNYFEKTYNEIELESRRLEEKKAKIIYDALDEKFNLSQFINLDNVDGYILKLYDLLLFSNIPLVQQECLSLLRNYNSNFSLLIPIIARCVFLPSTSEQLAKILIAMVRRTQIYSSISIENHSLDVATNQGSMHMLNAQKWIQDRHGYSIDNSRFQGQCHNVTFKFASYFPNYYATTILLANCLEGKCFHSFLTTHDNEFMVDLSVGAVVKKSDFYSVMGCEEILSVPTDYLQGMYKDLCSRDEVPDDMNPLLALAIDSMRRR